jgi:hypothetical protein
MSKAEKLLNKMRSNPRDWRLDAIETVAKRFDISVRKSGGSHVVLSHPDSAMVVTVPAHRPIKPIYVRQFLALLEEILE